MSTGAHIQGHSPKKSGNSSGDELTVAVLMVLLVPF